MGLPKWMLNKEAREALEAKQASKTVKKAVAVPGTSPALMPVNTGIQAGTDYNQHFEEVIATHNQPGPDYYEFSKAITSPALAALTEPQKYTITYGTYHAMGVASEDLVKSAEDYIARLDAEISQFDAEIRNARLTKVANKETLIQEEREAIERLTQQIQEKTANITRLSAEVSESALQLDAEENACHSAYTNRKNIINTHIANIKTYLK